MSRRKRRKKPKGINNRKKVRVILKAKTTNGQRIQGLLASRGKNPTKYKDYVVITNGQLVDWITAYNITKADGEPIVGPLALIHKSDLHRVIGDKFASKFWNKALGRRVAQKGPTPTEVADVDDK
jgi:hypothetical protein